MLPIGLGLYIDGNAGVRHSAVCGHNDLGRDIPGWYNTPLKRFNLGKITKFFHQLVYLIV